MEFTIMGDSWACGEWRGDPATGAYGVEHPGITAYLRRDGHDVRVVARGGDGNHDQAQQARRQGILGQAIWFITDPLRDLTERRLAREVQTLEQYRAIRDQQLRSALAAMRGHRMWLVGAVCPVPEWVEREFPEHRIITPDLTEWLLGHTGSEVLCRQWRHWRCGRDLADHLYHEERRREEHVRRAREDRASREHQLFWPDGEHPNRHAHLRLYRERIVPLL